MAHLIHAVVAAFLALQVPAGGALRRAEDAVSAQGVVVASDLDPKKCYCKSHPHHIGSGLYAKNNWSVKGPGGKKCKSTTPCQRCRRHGDTCCEAFKDGGKGQCGKKLKALGSADFKNMKCLCSGFRKSKYSLHEKNSACEP